MAFIPIYDVNKWRYIRWPYAAWGLILVNSFIFFFLQHGTFSDADQASVITFGLIPATINHLVERPVEFMEVPDKLTLITYAFLHGNFWHLAGNMIFLWVFADNVEDSLGHIRFIVFYFLCAVAAGYAYVWMDPSSQSPVIGASGAIAGVVAAYLLLHPYAKVWILILARIPVKITALWVIGFWIAFQVWGAIATPDDEIAWSSHLGGFVAGMMLAPFLRRRGVKLFSRQAIKPVVIGRRKVDGPPPPG